MIVENHIKIPAWYDNEWAYACRVIDLAETINERMRKTWNSQIKH
jgi:glyceraldehyde 3-phosphate dehydrogenase